MFSTSSKICSSFTTDCALRTDDFGMGLCRSLRMRGSRPEKCNTRTHICQKSMICILVSTDFRRERPRGFHSLGHYSIAGFPLQPFSSDYYAVIHICFDMVVVYPVPVCKCIYFALSGTKCMGRPRNMGPRALSPHCLRRNSLNYRKFILILSKQRVYQLYGDFVGFLLQGFFSGNGMAFVVEIARAVPARVTRHPIPSRCNTTVVPSLLLHTGTGSPPLHPGFNRGIHGAFVESGCNPSCPRGLGSDEVGVSRNN